MIHTLKAINMKRLIALFLTIFLIQSCIPVRTPKEHPLVVVGIEMSAYSDQAIYKIRDTNPKVDGLGEKTIYIYLKDERYKFNIGDTVIFNKK